MTDAQPPSPPVPASPSAEPFEHPWTPVQPVPPPKSGRNAKAAASIALGLLGLLAVVVCFSLSGLPSALPGFGGSAQQQVASMPIGSCYDEPAQHPVNRVTVVPCSGPHDRQLFARVRVGGSYPGLAEAEWKSLVVCQQALFADFVDPWALRSKGVELRYYYPVQSSWDSGGAAWCTVGPANGWPAVRGDLQQSAASRTAQQRAYLDTVRQTGLLRRELGALTPGGWRQGPALAAQLAVADRAEARALGSLSALDSDFLRAQGSGLARSDLAEATRAEALGAVTSQQDWTAGIKGFWDGSLASENETIRLNIGLPTSY
ncbi:septum formation family protein [Streptacidiphilus jiangxiensis]|uniref:Septum formation n=1 Tax=Streptacidiphilus jiangxiensis TaxID=235985 RepID=A0A1H7LCW5_STRJI|nr:septum formation family protein [Streptacidiphilus jiangxiensis]SEK96718.1 Septum formation [Streptacidiphilus jiangxiensis]